MRHSILVSVTAALVMVNGLAFAKEASSPLSLDAFLGEVRKNNQGIQASLSASTGAMERSGEGSLLFAPTLVGSAQLASDKKEPTTTLMGTGTNANSYSIGVQQQTPFGLVAKFSYGVSYMDIMGSQAINPAQFNEAKPTLELSQSLLRNGFGREMRASRDALTSAALAQSYAESFKAKVALAEAESTYWRLALARETVKVLQETLSRAQKMRDWSKNRVDLNLADKSDLLQSEAALQLRKLEYQSAVDEEQSAARAFNTSRGVASDEVPEKLEAIDMSLIGQLNAPKRSDVREDVKAALEQQRAAAASAMIGQEKNLPSLDLFGSIALNGKSTQLDTAVTNSLTGQHPTMAVGLKLSAPLDFATVSKNREGYRKEADATELVTRRKMFEQERDWQDLNAKLTDAQSRLEVSWRIEKIQKDKLTAERDRLERGRTTTFQVLLFEQDYLTSQLNRIRSTADILRLVAQMKTFSSAPAGSIPTFGGDL